MDNLVELSKVSKVYSDGRRFAALDAVSITVAPGQITAVMGPSGSGKSTLLHIMGGLDRPTTGSVMVSGTSLNRLNEAGLARFRRRHVGVVFQFFNLLNNLSALDNVLIPAQLAGARGSAPRQRAQELLDRLGIARLAAQYPARLSGGERQRVAIARALINSPSLLLADEPTGALDRSSGDEVLSIFRDLSGAGQTIVLVTHDEHLARANASRVVRLVDGSIADDGDVAVLGRVQIQ